MGDREIADIVFHIIDRVEHQGTAHVGYHEVDRWPDGARSLLEGAGLIDRASSGNEVVCTECEEECCVVPDLRKLPDGSFALVHLCERRSDIGFIRFPLQARQQWVSHLHAVAVLVRTSLALEGEVEDVRRGQIVLAGTRRFGRRRTRVYVVAGLGGRGAAEVAEVLARLVVGPAAVVLATSPTPGPDVWPHKSPSCLGLHGLLTVCRGSLCIDAEAIEATMTGKARAAPSVTFPVRPRRWEDVSITFVDEEHVHIRVGDTEGWYSFEDMGMTDARKDYTPNEAWLLMKIMARAQGTMDWSNFEAKDENRARIKQLRNYLRAFFGIEGDPIKRYRARVGWESRFTLRPAMPQ